MSIEQPTGAQDLVARVHDVIGASKVFGEPIQQDDVTVIPVTKVIGVGGVGSGSDPEKGQGFGGGLGWGSQATGVYVLRDGCVSWRPVVDVNQAIVAGSAVLITALFTLRAAIRLWTSRHR